MVSKLNINLANMWKTVINTNTSMSNMTNNVTNNSTFEVLFSQTEYNILSATLILIIATIVLGNASVLYIMYHDKNMRTPMYNLIASLAASDLGVGISTAPLTFTTVYNKGEWVLGHSACVYQALANSTFFIATMVTLMAMTMEKYFAIVRPLSRFVTPKRTKRFVAAAWILTLLISALPLIGFGRYGLSVTTMSCGIAFPKVASERMYLMLTLLLGFILPLAVMIIANCIIFKAIRKHSKRLRKHVQSKASKAGINASKKHFTVTVLIILAVFIVSWTPFLLLVVTAETADKAQNMPGFLGALAYWCGYAASAWNPIIYITRNARFRRGARKLVNTILCRRTETLSNSGSVTNVALSVRLENTANDNRRFNTM